MPSSTPLLPLSRPAPPAGAGGKRRSSALEFGNEKRRATDTLIVINCACLLLQVGVGGGGGKGRRRREGYEGRAHCVIFCMGKRKGGREKPIVCYV